MSLKPPTNQNGDDDLELTIRFSASLPDLLLTIASSDHATTSTLKQRIRARLPEDQANRRIRLIHAGKSLADDAALSTSLLKLRPVSRPPSRVSTPGPYDYDSPSAKAKGKAVVREPPLQQSRIYIHCSIGDLTLTAAELAAEARLAQSNTGDPRDQDGGVAKEQDQQEPLETTAPAPRGFDRLLTAGFSPAEVHSLRLQFLAIQAHTHTPDAMPSPTTLRGMEDQWLDNSNNASGDGAGGGGMSLEDEAQAGALDDMIFGTAMGFFWPVGCLMWAAREEGIWSQRRKMAVVIGVLVNVGLGLVRYSG